MTNYLNLCIVFCANVTKYLTKQLYFSENFNNNSFKYFSKGKNEINALMIPYLDQISARYYLVDKINTNRVLLLKVEIIHNFQEPSYITHSKDGTIFQRY